jgi:hypothetical protein
MRVEFIVRRPIAAADGMRAEQESTTTVESELPKMVLELVVGKMADQLVQVDEQVLRMPGLELASQFRQFRLVQPVLQVLDYLVFLVDLRVQGHLEGLVFLEAQQGRGLQGNLDFQVGLEVPGFLFVPQDLGHQVHLEILGRLVFLEVQQIPGHQENLELPDLR